MKTKRVGKKITKKNAKISKDILKEAKPEHYFFVQDGMVLKSVLDLSKYLDKMADDIFRHHVNEIKNDFASWIKDVFKEQKLAEELLKTTDKDRTQLIILKNIIKKFS